MTTRFAYPVDLSTDESGAVLAIFPDLAGAATDGADRGAALAEAADCLEEALAGCIARGDPIAPPSAAAGRPLVLPGPVIAAKAALYLAMRDAGIGKTELARRMGVAEGEVRRLLNPRHGSKIGRLNEALAVLGKGILVEVREIA